MGGKLNLYGLGDKGVDLVTTPLHQDPETWRQLQNAEFSNIQGQGGVKKRGALLRLNAAIFNAGAAILGIFNMPLETDALAAAGGGALYAGLNDGLGIYRSTDNGTTFTVIAGTGSVDYSTGTALGGIIYAFNEDTGAIDKINGTTVTVELAAFPHGEGGVALARSATKLWALVQLGAIYRVYSWVPGGSPAQFGVDLTVSTTNGQPQFIGSLAVNLAGDRVALGGNIWTDHATTTLHGIMWTGTGGAWTVADIESGSPLLSVGGGGRPALISTHAAYTGAGATGGGDSYITDGTTKLVQNILGSGVGGHDSISYDTLAIAFIISADAASLLAYVSTDGVTWTFDTNLTTGFSISPGASISGLFVTAAGSLLLCTGGSFYRRTAAGSWSLVNNASGLPASFIAVVQATS